MTPTGIPGLYMKNHMARFSGQKGHNVFNKQGIFILGLHNAVVVYTGPN